MKKALAGPAKPAARKKPKRRGIVATARRCIGTAVAAIAKSERKLERKIEERAGPPLARWAKRLGPAASKGAKLLRDVTRRAADWIGRRIRPVGALLFRVLARADAWLRRSAARCLRWVARGSAVVTPERALCAAIVGAAACLIISQFVDYRGVEVGQPGYAGLGEVASPPTVGVKVAGSAHAYLLVPLAAAAAFLSVVALRPSRRRLGRLVFGLGLVAIAVILLVDLPAGLDAGAQATRFAGAIAVLDTGFYAELAAAAGIAIGGLMLGFSQRARTRSARSQDGRRRTRKTLPRKPSEPLEGKPDDGLQSPAATMRGRA